MKNIVRFDLDFAGFVVSSLCAVHCASIPLLMIFFSSGILQELDNPLIEITVISLSLVIALLSLLPSYYRCHKKPEAIYCVLVGFLLIGLSRVGMHSSWQIVLTCGGAVLVALSHYLNRRFRIRASLN